ncbi:TraR/DksA C4-type zinc finger protein [Pseudomonas sp. URMO17WK12:I11]|uniref:TraR/DksA C4-type zinc finger protein n=1 Tax=Pseudomonas sp. URMO17WK12:I11 TaxID=1283291 RepID=UPI0009E74EDE
MVGCRGIGTDGSAAHSFLFCEGCDHPIPEDRRLAQPGCSQCVPCQSIEESREARHAR